MKRLLLPVAVLLLLPLGSLSAQEPSQAQVKFFETNIRPALVKYCYDCHSVEAGDSRAGLLLDSRQGWAQGGDSGPAIIPGDLDDSLVWEAVNWRGIEMPPSEKMPADVIANFGKWIAMGAPDPRERELLIHKTKINAEDIKEGRKHWAFQQPLRQADSSIDKLVSTKLDDAGLKPADAADAYTLLRRLHFDLVGLPPEPPEVQAFKSAFEADAIAAVKAKVDELLARPQYGERWGRHWLDVARYAESSGSRNVSYPHAWRYRDYVIDSFNDDTPYDRFIEEQVAGDLLPAKTDEQWQENLIATGFLAIGLKHHDQKNPRKFMADMVDEQIDTMTQAVLGLTVACARCHDHKYDPIPTDDYYALAGIFYSTKTLYGTLRIAQNHRPSELLLLPIDDKSPAQGRSQQTMASLKSRIEQLDRQMAGMRGKDRRQIRNVRNRVAGQLAALNPDGTPKAFGMGVQESRSMVNANILIGGEVDRPAQETPRGFVQVLGDLNFTVTNDKSSGRRELAKAMTSKDNPLTARVMANRVWMHLLGKPLVGTPSNFGLSGMKPDNQELLDHLAVRFMDVGWSVKSLIREIVLSETYRRSSRFDETNYRVDPDNTLLWRANPRQLDAESLRDAMLSVSGRLDLSRPSSSAVAAGRGRPGSANVGANAPHRSVYLPIVRDAVPDSLAIFDFPDPNISSAGRSDSIVPTQALYMMNGQFVTQQSQAFAAKLAAEHNERDQQVRAAFVWVYGRPATTKELAASAQFFREFKSSSPSMRIARQGDTQRPQAGPRGRRGAGGMGRQRPGGMARGPADMARGSRGMGRGPASRRGQDGAQQPQVAADPALAVFCQTLIASARFRILN